MLTPIDSARSTRNFDAIAATEYDSSIPEHVMAHLTRHRIELIQGHAACGKILDVGCGTGRLLADLPPKRFQRYGIDTSAGMLSQARGKGHGMHFRQGSATEIPFENNSFDVVFGAAVLHHIAEKNAVAQAIAEMVRVTKKGGTTIIWDHNPLNPYWPILMRRVPQDIGEERLIPKSEILQALKSSNNARNSRISCRQMTFIPDFAQSGPCLR